MPLNKRFDIRSVTCPRAVVLALGLQPRANTIFLCQITVQISYILYIIFYNI